MSSNLTFTGIEAVRAAVALLESVSPGLPGHDYCAGLAQLIREDFDQEKVERWYRDGVWWQEGMGLMNIHPPFDPAGMARLPQD
jgi:hypothetical protein